MHLLKVIADLGTGGPKKLHEATGVPVSTIHYRLSNLKDDGIIGGDLYDIGLEAFGLGVTVVVGALVNYNGSYEEVESKLLEIEGVTQFYFMMGETNFVVVVHLMDSGRVGCPISNFEAAPEVERTNSTFVVSSMCGNRRALQSYTLKTLLDELGIED